VVFYPSLSESQDFAPPGRSNGGTDPFALPVTAISTARRATLPGGPPAGLAPGHNKYVNSNYYINIHAFVGPGKTNIQMADVSKLPFSIWNINPPVAKVEAKET
jgi:hypothetical protein